MFRRVIFNSDTIGPSHRKARFDNALKGRRLPSRVIVYDPRFLDHVASPLHVERPERLGSVVARLQREGLFTEVTKAAPASLADLERVHRTPYLDLFRNLGEGLLDPETAVHPSTFEIASLAAGAVLHATRVAVRDGRPTVALVRPPGHHAGPDYGGGFCYLNNVAIAAGAQVAEGRRSPSWTTTRTTATARGTSSRIAQTRSISRRTSTGSIRGRAPRRTSARGRAAGSR